MIDSKENVQKSNSWLFLLFICIATCFMGIGFAKINTILGITGEVIAEAQDELFITEVNYVSNVGADIDNSKILTSYQTILSSDISLSQVNNNSNITYEVVIYNSTDKDYKFSETTYMLGEDTYNNESIVFSLDGLTKGDIVKSKESISFYITFKYKDNILATNNQLKSYINFVFKPNVILASAGTLNRSSTYGEFGGTISKWYIEEIYFVDHENVPNNATSVWDASLEGNYAITGWSLDDNQNGYYEIYLGADNGRISLPENSSALWYYFSVLKSIDFSNIDTSKVTDMSNMFALSFALNELDLSNFDTSNVTTMYNMFSSVYKIKVFDFSNWDFSKVTNINSILTGTSPQLVRFDTLTFDKYSSVNGVVPYISNDMTVVLKNEEEKTNFLNKNSSSIGYKTEFLTIDEYNTKYPNGKEIQ